MKKERRIIINIIPPIKIMVSQDVLDWIEQAQADLKSSRDMLNTGNYYASVIFSQQCAEKALKALFILQKNETPPKIHDLVELGRRVSLIKSLSPQAEKLTVTYFSSRYSGAAPKIPVKYYTLTKGKQHFHKAEAILQWVEKQIQ